MCVCGLCVGFVCCSSVFVVKVFPLTHYSHTRHPHSRQPCPLYPLPPTRTPPHPLHTPPPLSGARPWRPQQWQQWGRWGRWRWRVIGRTDGLLKRRIVQRYSRYIVQVVVNVFQRWLLFLLLLFLLLFNLGPGASCCRITHDAGT